MYLTLISQPYGKTQVSDAFGMQNVLKLLISHMEQTRGNKPELYIERLINDLNITLANYMGRYDNECEENGESI